MTLLNFVVMTHNLWGDRYADERTPALRRLYALRAPDLLAVQELRSWSRDTIDASMADHDRVVDDFAGWECQSNLWWRREVFEHVEYGAEDVGILDEAARLFWVRLRFVAHPEHTIVFSTGHLTWPGHALERESGINQRVPQATRVVHALGRIAGDGPCIFTVDINDIGGPVWQFGNSGFLDSFSALHRHSPPTHPVIPSGFEEAVGTAMSPLASPSKAIDWIFFRGSLISRTSEVVEFFDRGIAPSDHSPVAATLALTAGSPTGDPAPPPINQGDDSR